MQMADLARSYPRNRTQYTKAKVGLLGKGCLSMLVVPYLVVTQSHGNGKWKTRLTAWLPLDATIQQGNPTRIPGNEIE